MKQRCFNPTSQAYKIYGAKGITVCARWAESFDNFLADMGHRPPGLSIDRVDGSKGYEPGNCRWATAAEQSNNTVTNIRIEHNGETLTAAQWAHRVGGTRQLVLDRLKRGWTVADAVTLPHTPPAKHVMPDGTPAVDVARANGISDKVFSSRVGRLGWDVVRAATTPTDSSKNRRPRAN